MSACALILLILPAAAQSRSDADLGAELTRHVSAMKKDRQVLRFFEVHGWLLSDPRFAVEAKKQLRIHTLRLSRTQQRAAAAKAAIAHRARTRRLAAVAEEAPQNVICRVFGDYCQEALAVSRCESGLSADAQNGQYLGLFQMGSGARRLFGHGPSVGQQVTAAHRYFVASGRNWSPWSCKPWN